MKRSPIVTTRDARLSLWTSMVESQLKKKNPDLSLKEVRNLPAMQGVYAHVCAAEGKPVEDLTAEEQKQQLLSEESYKGVTTIQLMSVNEIEDDLAYMVDLANYVNGDQAGYNQYLIDHGIRTFSDEDYGDWAVAGLNWLVAITSKQRANDSNFQKFLHWLEDNLTFNIDQALPWIGQASDTAIQKYLAYRPWHNSGQGKNYSKISWKLPNDGKVLVLGDWGTSLDDAKKMLQAVWTNSDPCAIIHLGDIYYSGTVEECVDNYLNVFLEVAATIGKPMVPIFSIPGNHEYYSFGDGFFYLADNMYNTVPYLNQSQYKQPASYFCLQTEDQKWQFLGMDTGQDDNNPIVTAIDSFAPKLMGDLDQYGELAWHTDKLTSFPGQTILMSHHQLFSQNAVIDKKVTPFFSRYLHSYFSPFFNKIAAWFWGHEHSFALFEDGIYGLAKGRLVGSSSYEVPTDNNVYTNNFPLVPLAGFNRPHSSNGFYDHVCAVINLERQHASDPLYVDYWSFPSWGQNDTVSQDLLDNPQNHLSYVKGEEIPASPMKAQTWSGNYKIDDGVIECKNTPSLCTDGSKIYFGYQDPSDILCYADLDMNLSNGHMKSLGNATDHSPSITIRSGKIYMLFSDKNDSSKLTYKIYQSGSWGDAHHVNDSHSNTIKVGSGISSVWLGSTLYISFIENGTDNVRIVTFNGSTWSYSTPSGNPESETIAPGVGVSGNVLYLLFADKNNSDFITYQTYSSGSWSNPTLINNGVTSAADMAYPKAHDNISVGTEADGKITATYRGKDNVINWLTFDPSKSIWYGAVSLPRLGKDQTVDGYTAPLVPATSESAGVVGLPDGLLVCFRGKSTNDIRWVRRTDA